MGAAAALNVTTFAAILARPAHINLEPGPAQIIVHGLAPTLEQTGVTIYTALGRKRLGPATETAPDQRLGRAVLLGGIPRVGSPRQ